MRSCFWRGAICEHSGCGPGHWGRGLRRKHRRISIPGKLT
jgi:hypothetical protein